MQYKPVYGFYADTITPKVKLSFTFSSQKQKSHNILSGTQKFNRNETSLHVVAI